MLIRTSSLSLSLSLSPSLSLSLSLDKYCVLPTGSWQALCIGATPQWMLVWPIFLTQPSTPWKALPQDCVGKFLWRNLLRSLCQRRLQLDQTSRLSSQRTEFDSRIHKSDIWSILDGTTLLFNTFLWEWFIDHSGIFFSFQSHYLIRFLWLKGKTS